MQNSVFSELEVTSLFGCAYYLSAEQQGSKQSKESEKTPKPMTVYMGCVGAGKAEEEEGTWDALAVSLFSSAWFFPPSFPLSSIFAYNIDVVTAGKATTALLWKRLDCLIPGSLVCAASSPSHLSWKDSSDHHHRSLLCHPKRENKAASLKVLVSKVADSYEHPTASCTCTET